MADGPVFEHEYVDGGPVVDGDVGDATVDHGFGPLDIENMPDPATHGVQPEPLIGTERISEETKEG